MEFGIGTYGLGYLAGVLSTLSPCVLPLVPIVLGSAVTAHRWGALALAAGLVLSFTAVGIFIATIGASIGLTSGLFRDIAALLLIGFGVVLMSGTLQARFATATAGIGDAGQVMLSKINIEGLSGQFLIGLLLGVVWSPCVGPTLGAASTLASQGQSLLQVSLLIMIFGLGAGTPLLVLGSLSRTTTLNMRGKLQSAGKFGKYALGGLMMVLGIFVLSGLDKSLEAFLVQASPDWLTDLTSRF
jgi:cytochrome c-type biogenesis protein